MESKTHLKNHIRAVVSEIADIIKSNPDLHHHLKAHLIVAGDELMAARGEIDSIDHIANIEKSLKGIGGSVVFGSPVDILRELMKGTAESGGQVAEEIRERESVASFWNSKAEKPNQKDDSQESQQDGFLVKVHQMMIEDD